MEKKMKVVKSETTKKKEEKENKARYDKIANETFEWTKGNDHGVVLTQDHVNFNNSISIAMMQEMIEAYTGEEYPGDPQITLHFYRDIILELLQSLSDYNINGHCLAVGLITEIQHILLEEPYST